MKTKENLKIKKYTTKGRFPKVGKEEIIYFEKKHGMSYFYCKDYIEYLTEEELTAQFDIDDKGNLIPKEIYDEDRYYDEEQTVFDSIDDFPEVGNEDLTYFDTSTGKSYFFGDGEYVEWIEETEIDVFAEPEPMQDIKDFIKSMRGKTRAKDSEVKKMFELYTKYTGRTESNYSCSSCVMRVYKKLQQLIK